jgi:hypothetical protein
MAKECLSILGHRACGVPTPRQSRLEARRDRAYQTRFPRKRAVLASPLKRRGAVRRGPPCGPWEGVPRRGGGRGGGLRIEKSEMEKGVPFTGGGKRAARHGTALRSSPTRLYDRALAPGYRFRWRDESARSALARETPRRQGGKVLVHSRALRRPFASCCPPSLLLPPPAPPPPARPPLTLPHLSSLPYVRCKHCRDSAGGRRCKRGTFARVARYRCDAQQFLPR